MKSFLVLKNGKTFEGYSPPWQKGIFYGEVVFTTGMTGYPESLTDPSYTGQILTFTYPLIGNYGVPPKELWESLKVHARGVVVSEACEMWSHHNGMKSLLEWLEEQKVPVIMGVDTRAITKMLRSHGTMLGAITNEIKKKYTFFDPNKEHLVSCAARREVSTYGKGKKVVIAIDCGMKENILRSLSSYPITIRRVPYDYDFTKEHYDGIFISNGPGNPVQCPEAIPHLRKAMKGNKPIFGICLGTQLLALAAGAKTFKLPFGHRGQNQPCIDLKTQQCYITSQNHGYAVDDKSLPKGWEVTFKNLNDGSVEGIAHKTKPFFAVQFHPEASPGPTDTRWLFDKFYKAL
ncbi:MAG: Carbamoyl-phosphate synthase small chain [Chlamydiae bacterium]|nr:Carbamoyl-phosphate synthase small chain [Chlamydiota bacterium]